jgi:hypothetical protein
MQTFKDGNENGAVHCGPLSKRSFGTHLTNGAGEKMGWVPWEGGRESICRNYQAEG